MLGRGLRWIREQLAFLAAFAVLLASFVYLIVDRGRWGRGSGAVAVAMLLAGVLRAVLPSTRAGMLAVRSRWLDSLFYLVLGGAILALDIRLHH